MTERVREPEGFRHSAGAAPLQEARSHDRWVVNKLRALGSWYTKGHDNGSRLRTAINSADSVNALRAIVEDFFLAGAATPRVSSTQHLYSS
jgi:hypothetical protein